MREVHLMNLIEMYNIMTSFNKIKFKYLIQVWEDVMKIIRNVKNVDVEKILWWRHHLNIPPPPYVAISHHLTSFVKTPKRGFLEISQNSQENTCARVSFSIKGSLNKPGSLF